MKDMNEIKSGKSVIIAEAEKRFKRDIIRIETNLKTAPSKEKYLALEKSILFNILRKDIDVLNDCTAVKKTWYYRTGHLEWPLDDIRLIRTHYNNYLKGIVNFSGKSLTVTEVLDEPIRKCIGWEGNVPVLGKAESTIEWPRAEAIINAVRFFMLEEWLNSYRLPLHNQLTAQDSQYDLAEIADAENKFLKGIPMQIVIDHFRVLTTEKSKNGSNYLTPEQLVSFLKRGFLGDSSQPIQKINCASGEKGFVIKRFYEFYDLAASRYSYPNKKKDFIELFTSCFDNWNTKSVTAFFKPDKVKEKW